MDQTSLYIGGTSMYLTVEDPDQDWLLEKGNLYSVEFSNCCEG